MEELTKEYQGIEKGMRDHLEEILEDKSLYMEELMTYEKKDSLDLFVNFYLENHMIYLREMVEREENIFHYHDYIDKKEFENLLLSLKKFISLLS